MSGTPNEESTAVEATSIDQIRKNPNPAYAAEHKWKTLVLLDRREWRIPRLSIIPTKRETAARKAQQKLMDVAMAGQKIRADVAALEGNVRTAERLFDKLVDVDAERAIPYFDKLERYRNEQREAESKAWQRYNQYRETGAEFAYECLALIYPKISLEVAAELVDQGIVDLMLQITQGVDIDDENPTKTETLPTGPSNS